MSDPPEGPDGELPLLQDARNATNNNPSPMTNAPAFTVFLPLFAELRTIVPNMP